MNFIEKPFLWFILVVFTGWLLVRKWPRASQTWLLIASLVFYGFHDWPLVFLILAYCVVDWSFGLWLARGGRSRSVLLLGVTLNLLGLVFWKYTPMLIRTAAWVALRLDLGEVGPPPDNWLLPIGISFYAFTGIAYMVDVYRGEAEAERNLFRFSLFITFFPQLVAGPILRAGEFLPQLQTANMPTRGVATLDAATLIARGFFKKMVLADRIALAIDPFFAHVGGPATEGVWSLPFVWLYALQIYFDFSGYTDIARGLGLLFGFRWPDNFNLPYLASSVQDFWQRWHLTLSRFLRDYLYIPLGGNRLGKTRTMVNLMATMLLGGLWHGASWSFMIWGGLHGLYLALHRGWMATPFPDRLAKAPAAVRQVWHVLGVVVTFHLVCLAWCFFRLTDVADSFTCVRKWFVFDSAKVFAGNSGDVSLWLLLAVYGLLVFTFVQAKRLFDAQPLEEFQGGWGGLVRGFLWGTSGALLLLAFVMSPAGEQPAFIYFRF
jgi:alginate O-acetyltransferase complex protein AlgI